MSGLPGPISGSEGEPAFADLSGGQRISGFGLQNGAGGKREGPAAARDACLGSCAFAPLRRFRRVT